MRILANYGYRDNGNNYNVSFETLGDVPLDKAATTVNELFKLAKQAVLTQVELNGSSPTAAKAPEINPLDTVSIPSNPKEVTVNGNGNIRIKDPTLPASQKQVDLLQKLARRKKVQVKTAGLNKLQASQLIDSLMNR